MSTPPEVLTAVDDNYHPGIFIDHGATKDYVAYAGIEEANRQTEQFTRSSLLRPLAPCKPATAQETTTLIPQLVRETPSYCDKCQHFFSQGFILGGFLAITFVIIYLVALKK